MRAWLAVSLGIALTACGGGGGTTNTVTTLVATTEGKSRLVANTRYNYQAGTALQTDFYDWGATPPVHTTTVAPPSSASADWTWGDGTTSPNSTNATKVWHRAGAYSIGFKAISSTGQQATSTIAATVIGTPVISGSTACAIRTDYSVACWGNNNFGQLGNASLVDSNAPVVVKGLVDRAVALSGNYAQTCALLHTGVVVCWGAKSLQAPDPNQVNPTPTAVAGLSNVVAISSGAFHHCALQATGTVSCWGVDSHSVLGNGPSTENEVAAPVPVSSIPDAIVLATGADGQHNCVIRADRSVWCWGANDHGQTGGTTMTTGYVIATPVDTQIPVQVPNVSDAVSLTLTAGNSCAVLANGAMQCWGSNMRGQNASGMASGFQLPSVHFYPAPVMSPLSELAAIGQGNFSCALKMNGSVSCWAEQVVQSGPHQASPEAVVSQLGTDNAYVSGGENVCVLKTDGRLFCRGVNYAGQLGTGTNDDSPVVFQEVLTSAALPIVGAVSAGEIHTCALKGDRTVWCWGVGAYGELGIIPNGAHSADVPTYTSTWANVEALATGLGHTCAIYADRTVACVGKGNAGQLGNNLGAYRAKVIGLNNVKAMAAGGDHSCALRFDGTVACWGSNVNGELGNGTTANSNSPVEVVDIGGVGFLTNVKSIANGEHHSCAVKVDGSLVCWGRGDHGQLGNGSSGSGYQSTTPVLVNSSNLYTSVSIGEFHSCAVTTTGTVDCWGFGDYGHIGNGVNSSVNLPVAVNPFGKTVIAVAAGYNHTCALLRGGTSACWGLRRDANLSGVFENLPSIISGVSGANQISAGRDYTCAHHPDGSVKCWGSNGYGNLGNNKAQKVSASAVTTGINFTTLVQPPTLAFWK